MDKSYRKYFLRGVAKDLVNARVTLDMLYKHDKSDNVEEADILLDMALGYLSRELEKLVIINQGDA